MVSNYDGSAHERKDKIITIATAAPMGTEMPPVISHVNKYHIDESSRKKT